MIMQFNDDMLKAMQSAVKNCTLKVKDRVKVIGSDILKLYGISDGVVGTIVSKHSVDSIGVCLDPMIDIGHTCNGLCEDRRGWYFHPISLEKIEESVIMEECKVAKFKVGDRVKLIEDNLWGKKEYIGYSGTIIEYRISDYGVEFEAGFDGHTLDGKIKNRCGWYFEERCLELVAEESKKSKKHKKNQQRTCTYEYPEREYEVATKENGKEVERHTVLEPIENIKCIINEVNETIVVILDNGTKGIAKCLSEDEFDIQKGFDIAYLKAKIKSLQKQLKQLTK
jgi:hypothetical protein